MSPLQVVHVEVSHIAGQAKLTQVMVTRQVGQLRGWAVANSRGPSNGRVLEGRNN